jgi:hypothetical protein
MTRHAPSRGFALPGGRSAVLLGVAIVIVAAVVPYLGTLGSGFVFDDHILIVKNPALRPRRECRDSSPAGRGRAASVATRRRTDRSCC